MDRNDLDRYLDQLVESALQPDDSVAFSHAYLQAPLIEVVQAIPRIVETNGFKVLFGLTGNVRRTTRHESVLAPIGRGDCLLWHFCMDASLLAQLSMATKSTVRWVFVDSGVRAWCYQEYRSGRLLKEVLDPEEVLRSPALSGNDLRGTGPRKFDCLSDFLNVISPWYEPKDQTWLFGRWTDHRWRNETLGDPMVRLRHSLRVVVSPQTVDLEFLGSWTSSDQLEVQTRLPSQWNVQLS
jgi:hypothetical protein